MQLSMKPQNENVITPPIQNKFSVPDPAGYAQAMEGHFWLWRNLSRDEYLPVPPHLPAMYTRARTHTHTRTL